MPPRLRYALLLLFTLPLGFAVRFWPLHQPDFLSKYGGSALWAVAIFYALSLLLPHRSLATRTAAALLLAFAIEFFKLVRTPALDAFRLTLPGKLALGRFFSFQDLVAYAAGIFCAAALDRAAINTPRSRNPAIR